MPSSPGEPPEPTTRPTPRVLVLYNRSDTDAPGLARKREAADEVIDVAAAVSRVLVERGCETVTHGVHGRLDEVPDVLDRVRPDVVFNLVEELGDDPRREPEVPELLAALAVPFTGNRAPALRRALAKDRVRKALAARGIPLAKGFVVNGANPLPLPDQLDVTYPLFVKPARADGSIGVDQGSVVGSYVALVRRIHALRRAIPGPILVEEYLPGTEINIAVFPRAKHGIFAPTLVDFTAVPEGYWPVVTYEGKWVESSPEFLSRSVPVTTQVDRDTLNAAIAIAKETLVALDIDSYARVDFRLDRDGRPCVMDVNPNPALHPTAGFATALSSVGIPFGDMIKGLVDEARARRGHARPSARAKRPAGLGRVALAN